MRWAILLLLAPLALAQSPWPGQIGNSVGYAAYGPLTATACGAFSTGSSWSLPSVVMNCTYSTAQTINCNFCEFIGVDFNAGTSGTLVSGSHVLFLGDRFQSNQIGNYNVQTTGADIWIIYSSVTPLASLYTSPPGYLWPSAASGGNTTTMTDNVNAVAVNKGYQYGINVFSGGPVYIDHCDVWGFGNSVVYYTTTAQMTLTNSFIHDAAQYTGVTGGDYHTDGPGYENGAVGTSNLLIQGNTVASLGNSNGLALQAATGGYSNVNVVSNYFGGGFGYTITPGDVGPTHLTNSALTLNTFGTDVEPIFGVLHGATLGAGTVWACNNIAFRAGTTWTAGGWTPASGDNGKYWVLSNSAPASATDQGGNTVCVSPAPSSLNFLTIVSGASSTSQTITLSCSNTANCTFSSIALNTGTDFSIGSNTCGVGITAGTSCQVTVKFVPSSLGPKSDSVVITDNMSGVGSPQTIPLLGIGVGSASAPALGMFAWLLNEKGIAASPNGYSRNPFNNVAE